MKRRQLAFTLMELMMTLAIAGIILAIGAPNFVEFRRNNRMTSVANDFLGALQTARTEAIKRQQPVAVCPSANPDTAGAGCSNGAFTGWIVFVDADNNCLRDAAGNDIVRASVTIDPAVTPVSNGVCLSFGANGFLQTIAGQATASRTVFCDARGNTLQSGTLQSAARGIDVSPTGRSRITRDMAEIGSWGPGVGCP
ncbi:MAG: GspH/FimT family pseudopilin [Gammaproteobacteria bacterium]|nr:GspH/FimT family pseudopilin [Gammaproteobacteria bacterium]